MSRVSDQSLSYKRRPPNWFIAYCVLALFSVVVVGVCLFLSNKIISIYEEGTKRGQQIAVFEDKLLSLSRSAVNVSAPGFAHAFDTKKIADDKKKYLEAYNRFKAELYAVKKEISASDDELLKVSLLFHLNAAKSSLFSLHWEVEAIFETYAAGDIDATVSHMSLMETYSADLVLKIGRAIADGRVVMKDILDDQHRFLDKVRAYGFAMICAALAIIFGAAIFGYFEKARTREGNHWKRINWPAARIEGGLDRPLAMGDVAQDLAGMSLDFTAYMNDCNKVFREIEVTASGVRSRKLEMAARDLKTSSLKVGALSVARMAGELERVAEFMEHGEEREVRLEKLVGALNSCLLVDAQEFGQTGDLEAA